MKKTSLLVAALAIVVGLQSLALADPIAGTDFSNTPGFNDPGGEANLDNANIDDLKRKNGEAPCFWNKMRSLAKLTTQCRYRSPEQELVTLWCRDLCAAGSTTFPRHHARKGRSILYLPQSSAKMGSLPVVWSK